MIPLCIPEIKGNEWKYIKDCLDTNWVSSVGSYVDLFEERFAAFLDSPRCIVTVNGTAALHLSLEALGIGQGDEVIVPSMTFISPVNAIKYTGAQPVFADVCRDTFVMDVTRMEELITDKTKAILPVHIYGHPVDMDPLMEIAKKYGLYVIEDATESLGSTYKGRQTGTIGNAGCFSFNGNKLITTGAGGMISTNDTELGNRLKYLSNQAKTGTDNGAFYHVEAGYNYRMPNIVAAMGVAQLESINEYIEVKRKNANLYNQLLKGAKGITLPVEKEWATNINWLYSVVIEDEYGTSRDEVIKKLSDNGIQSRPFFMPVHEMPPYEDCRHGDMESTEFVSSKGINLPSSVSLKEEEIKYICECLRG